MRNCPKCDSACFDGVCADCGYGAWDALGPAIRIGQSSYPVVMRPDGTYGKPEHIQIAERALGHTLPFGAMVHHHDRDKTNNKNSNLVICENGAYHHLIHARMNALANGIDPDKEKYCPECKLIKPHGAFYNDRSRRWDGKDKRCKSCSHLHKSELKRRRKSQTSSVRQQCTSVG